MRKSWQQSCQHSNNRRVLYRHQHLYRYRRQYHYHHQQQLRTLFQTSTKAPMNSAACVSAFEYGENVLRFVRRHMYHRECRHNYMQILNQSGARNCQCPSCRGAGTMVAAWQYIDPTLITQRLNGGERAATESDMFAEQYEISTPRSSTLDFLCIRYTTATCAGQH